MFGESNLSAKMKSFSKSLKYIGRELSSWSSSYELVSRTISLEFKSQACLIEHRVDIDKPPLQHSSNATFPQNSSEDKKKKVFAESWFYLSPEFRISCCQVSITWQKTEGARDASISPPSVLEPKEHRPPPTSMPMPVLDGEMGRTNSLHASA